MDRARLDRIEELFHGAAGLAPGARAAFLDQECAGDAPLRARVERMLGHDEGATTQPVAGLGRALGMDGTDAPRIAGGRYELLKPIGEGGCGVVYLAEQREPVRRRVAVKVIRHALGAGSSLARFEAERQALALMDHPCVASVLDAGRTDAGLPYFVMPYIRGEPVTAYCDAARLTVEERAALMVEVCAGVLHAHQKGIIHRDLKPSNILVERVDGRPVPRVIDFGIAKAIDLRLAGRTLVTEPGALIGTPEYMSPEQAADREVDTRTDVYSLGVVLYELLSGSLPFDSGEARSGGLEALLRTIRERDPARPSTRLGRHEGGGADAETIAAERRTTTRALRKRLHRDLDWVVMKCLEKEPARRYAGVGELADDLRRFLRGEALAAGPPGMVYRASKFARRHRVGVAAGVVVGAAVLGAAAVSGYFAWRAVRSAAAARVDAERSDEIAAFARRMLGGVDPRVAQGMDRTLVRSLLARAATDLDAAPPRIPRVEAAVRRMIGEAYASIGDWLAAEPHLVKALGLFRADPGADDPETVETAISLVTVWTALRKHEVYRLILDTRERADRLFGEEDRRTLSLIRPLAEALRNNLREYAACRRVAGQGAALLERVLGPDDPETMALALTAAWIDENGYRFEQAMARVQPVLERATAKFGPRHPLTLQAVEQKAQIFARSKRLDEAIALRRERMPDFEEGLGSDNPLTIKNLYGLGEAVRDSGRPAEAEPMLRRAYEAQRRIAPPGDEWTVWVGEEWAAAIEREGRLDEAERLMLDLASEAEAGGPEYDARVCDAWDRLFRFYTRHGRPADAARFARLSEERGRAFEAWKAREYGPSENDPPAEPK